MVPHQDVPRHHQQDGGALDGVYGKTAGFLTHIVIFLVTVQYLNSYYSSFIFASFAAWSAAMQASIISWISPFMILSSLYRVRPMRWSVTRPWGKL